MCVVCQVNELLLKMVREGQPPDLVEDVRKVVAAAGEGVWDVTMATQQALTSLTQALR